MEAVFVPACVEGAVCEDDGAEGPVELVRRGNYVRHPAVRSVPNPYQVPEELAVGGGVEEVSEGFEVGLDDVGVDYVAVVCEGEAACLGGHAEGLDVLHSADFRGGVADVAYQCSAGEPGEVFFFEDVLHEARALMDLQRAVIPGYYHAAALLAAVLEGLECEECEAGCMFYSVDSKDAAFFV